MRRVRVTIALEEGKYNLHINSRLHIETIIGKSSILFRKQVLHDYHM